jgi:hypothetical protein
MRTDSIPTEQAKTQEAGMRLLEKDSKLQLSAAEA